MTNDKQRRARIDEMQARRCVRLYHVTDAAFFAVLFWEIGSW